MPGEAESDDDDSQDEAGSGEDDDSDDEEEAAAEAEGTGEGEESEDSDDDDDSDDSEDEDEAGMRLQIAKHKKQLANLQAQDPEFFEYMQKEGGGLMDFGQDVDTADLDDKVEDDDDDEDDEEEEIGDSMQEDEDEDEDAAPEEKAEPETAESRLEKAQSGKKPFSMATLEKWEAAAKRGKEPAVNSLLRAFDAAAVLLSDGDDGPKPKQGARKGGKQQQPPRKKSMSSVRRFKYKIESGDVFDALLVCMTREMPSILLDEMLGRPQATEAGEDDEERPRAARWKPQRSPKWGSLSKQVGGYCRNLLALLTAVTETEMVSWVLRAVSSALPLISAVPKLPRELLKISLTLWATGEESVRARSFVVIHKLCSLDPKKLLALTLKGMYLTYVRHTKTSNPTALPRINFFVACITDIYGLDMELSYQHAFMSIRQLAVTLRTALGGKTKDASNAVCCWPFVNALRCWGQVLGRYPAESELGLLIYPYTQVVLGSVKVASTPATFPMRFLLLRFLTHVASAPRVGTYIPLAPYLLEVFDAAALKGGKGKKRGSDIKPPPIEHVLKVSTKVVTSRLYQQQVVQTACEILVQSFGPLAYSISFPELVSPAEQRLKRFAKETPVGQFRKAALQAASQVRGPHDLDSRPPHSKICAVILTRCCRAQLTRNASWVETLREECGYELLRPSKLGGVALREMETVAAGRGGAEQHAPLALYLKQHEAVAATEAEETSGAHCFASAQWSVVSVAALTRQNVRATGERERVVTFEGDATVDPTAAKSEAEDDSDEEPAVDPEVLALATAAAEAKAAMPQKKKKKDKSKKKKKKVVQEEEVDVMAMEDEVADVDESEL